MLTINPDKTSIPKFHRLFLGAIAPRPIAFASTMDKDGNPNLAPFSFFNAFGVNPTTLIFSPARRGRDNTTKHTLDNLKELDQVVINVVNFAMVEQVNLASTEYEKGVDEFVKAGFTALKSEKVKPFRVMESPVQFECKVREIIETSGRGGSANLVICEVLLMHIDENILDDEGWIDHDKIDLVGRLGGPWYCRTSGNAKFRVQQPVGIGLGIDMLPEKIRHSKILTGNDLAKLAGLAKLPSTNEAELMMDLAELKEILDHSNDKLSDIHLLAKTWIAAGKIEDAAKILML
jgi:flavin reductase (DIM6/NTAB) family NADH-FMN oxidoreductase RutF